MSLFPNLCSFGNPLDIASVVHRPIRLRWPFGQQAIALGNRRQVELAGGRRGGPICDQFGASDVPAYALSSPGEVRLFAAQVDGVFVVRGGRGALR